MLAIVAASYAYERARSDAETARKHAAGNAFFVLFFCYPTICNTLFASFICTDLFDGHSVLDADDRVLCEDPDHVSLQGASLVLIVLVACGVPVLIATLLPLGAFQAEQDPSYAAAIVQLNVKIQQIANDLGSTTLVDVYSVFEGNPVLMSNDGLHPPVAGYAARAQAFYDAIVSAFEGLTLTVTKSGEGSGTVTSSPVDITCGDARRKPYL